MIELATLLALASGGLVGLVLGVIGGGGSILALPLLVYVVGFQGDPHVAIGTSALAVAATAAMGLSQHRASGHVRLDVGLLFAIPGVAGALLGAHLGLATPGRALLAAFAGLMLVAAWRMWTHKDAASVPADASSARMRWPLIVGAGLLVGLLAGYFGIGGGFLVVPALVWAARLDMRRAMATSLVAVAAFGLATATRYGIAGAVDLRVAALFIAGGAIGAVLGARAAPRVPKAALQKAFALALVAVAAAMLLA